MENRCLVNMTLLMFGEAGLSLSHSVSFLVSWRRLGADLWKTVVTLFIFALRVRRGCNSRQWPLSTAAVPSVHTWVKLRTELVLPLLWVWGVLVLVCGLNCQACRDAGSVSWDGVLGASVLSQLCTLSRVLQVLVKMFIRKVVRTYISQGLPAHKLNEP